MQAKLTDIILEKRECVLSLWQAAALPQDRGFSSKAGAQAGSPLAYALPTSQVLHGETASLFEWVMSDTDSVLARKHLREICKVKAVEAQGPSEALGFILELKEIFRLVLAGTDAEQALHASPLDTCQMSRQKMLNDLDKRIDQLLLLAFDEYMEWRERIMNIKIEESQRLTGRCAQ